MAQKPDFSTLVSDTRKVWLSGKTRDVEWRRQQLRNLLRMLEENEKLICEAIHKDLHKHPNEVRLMEMGTTRSDLVLTLDNLDEWTSPEKVKKNVMVMMDDCHIQYQPYGVVLILGAWNYPVQVALQPLVGAIAAGNCAVIKPSEVSEHASLLLEKLVPAYLDKECIHVVSGGIPETTALLREQWDYICYTGNGTVAKIIYEAAAKHLTPVTLELGGKSPVFVDADTDYDVTARRLIWGRFSNCGQTCIAADYVLCTPDTRDRLVEALRKHLPLFYGENPRESDSYGRIINNRHWNRVKNLLTSGRVVIGGDMDESDNYISPTVLVDVKPSDPVMQEEIFGPVLPILTVTDADEAVDFINSRDKPLALYVFSRNRKTTDKFLTRTSSGGMAVNDCLLHAGVETLPFGGVGASGVGAYHGKFSFLTFSHQRAVLVRKQVMEKLNDVRYPPYTDMKMKILNFVNKKNPRRGWFSITQVFKMAVLGIALGVFLKMLGVSV